MGQPAARLGDMHTCPMVTPGTPPIPHVGGPIVSPGVPTVLIGLMPASVVGDMCTCVGPPDSIIKGSATVFIGGRMAARMGDSTVHGGVITIGCPTVLIGDMGSGGGASGGAGQNSMVVDGNLFDVSGPQSKDISQGELGDCFLLASLGAIANQNPDKIREIVRANGDGTYSVTLYKKDWLGFYESSDTVVDSTLTLSNGTPKYARYGQVSPDGKPELWVAMIEKGYAEKNGGYDEINKGGHPSEAMSQLLGQSSKVYKPADLTLDQLAQKFEAHDAIALASLPNDQAKGNALYVNGDLVSSHGYYVTGVNKDKGTITVKNPWGWEANPTSELSYDEFKSSFDNVSINEGTRN